MCLLAATEAILDNVPQGKTKVFMPADFINQLSIHTRTSMNTARV